MVAVHDLEIGKKAGCFLLQENLRQDGQWWRVLVEYLRKIAGGTCLSIEPNMHTVSAVIDHSGQPHALRQGIHEGAESYPLNLAGNM